MGLLTPGFLVAGVLMAGIPLLIHFLNRRRFREQSWAAMDFLLRAMKKNRKRLRFEQWLLLAVRCLLLGLLGLALARPMGCGGDALSGLARQAGLHVIVLDDSYSMGFEGGVSGTGGSAAGGAGGGTHFERGKAVALAAVDRMTAGGDAVAVVMAGAPARLVFAPGYDLEAAKGVISRAEVGAGGTDLVGALRIATTVAREGSAQPLRQLRIISDGTRSSLGLGAAGAGAGASGAGVGAVVAAGAGEGGGGGSGEALKQVAVEAAGVFTRVAFHHLGASDQRQAAVMGLSARSALLTVRQSQEMAAVARAFGGEELRTVQWRLDEAVLPGGGEVKVSEAGDELVLGQLKFGRPGARVVTARLLGNDRLGVDDVRRRVVEVADRVRVLLVEGERGGGVLGSSGAFLRVALAPGAAAGGVGGGGVGGGGGGGVVSNSALDPESVSDLELSGKVLSDYRVVILAGVGQVAEGTADQLKAFVEAGGVLVVFAGEPVSMENYNRVMLPRGLLPGALVKRVVAVEGGGAGGSGGGISFDFRPTGNLHPMLEILRGEERSGLDTAQVYTYLQVEMSGGIGGVGGSGVSKAERVLNFTGGGAGGGVGGDAAITTQKLGLGRVVFVATSAGADGWTALPGKPVFVTLVQEMIATSVSAAGEWMNVEVGRRLELPAGLRLVAAPTLADAGGRSVGMSAEASRTGGDRSVWRSEVLSKPGMYMLSGVAGSAGGEGGEGGGEAVTLPVVVNVDAVGEADVRTVDEAGLKVAMGGVEMEVLRDQLPAEAGAEEAKGADFGWAVMLLVLVMVGFESVMAMRFGHHGR